MKALFSAVVSLLALSPLTVSWQQLEAQELRLLTTIDPATAPTGGGGDSSSPVLSPDGRFVAFASNGKNFVLLTNGAVVPPGILPSLDVYLRDRTYGTNTLVSVNVSGLAGGNGDSVPLAVSSEGRFVLFQSAASDLVENDTNGGSDIFVRDLLNGTTILVSAATNGLPGNGPSRSAVMTPDGRFVAWVSAANNLVSLDTNNIPDVFVRDMQSGTTVLASVGAISTTQIGSSESPDITADGHYVAFHSSASNLVTGTGTRLGSDIYIRDLQANTTVLASAYSRVAVPSNNVACFNHVFSGDGDYLVYEAAGKNALAGVILRYRVASGLTDLVGTNATVPRSAYEDIRSLDISGDGRIIAYIANHYTADGSTTCVKLWDAQSGTTTIVSGNTTDSGVQVGSFCDWPCLDTSGRYVAFLSSATNMVTNSVVGNIHLYLHDSQQSRRTLLDGGTNGIGWEINPSTAPRLSADGRLVAFESRDGALVGHDSNRDFDVFVRNLDSGAVELISAHDPALPSRTPNGPSSLTLNSISADGRFVAFASEADNLIASDTNQLRDIFLADLSDGSIRLVSADTNGLPADGVSSEPAISDDGRWVAFTSMADNLVAGDPNRNLDVFLRDMQSGTTTLVSINQTGLGPGNSQSYTPIISADGRFVLFRSQARDLATGTFLAHNLFLRDRVLGTNYALTTSGITTAAMTPDGRFVAYADSPGAGSGIYYVWNSLMATRTTNTTVFAIVAIAISPDGNSIAYCAGSGAQQVYLADRQTGAARIISTVLGLASSLTFSASSQVLVYQQPVNSIKQIFCYDLQRGSSSIISTDFASGQPANGHSDSPAISTDGRFIAYRSGASNIVSHDANGQPDVFIYDRLTAANAVLTAGAAGTSNYRSLLPVFSRDGSTLAFVSGASDLGLGDFNHSSDLFTYTFLSAVLLPGNGGAQPPTISWPWLTGRNYLVEFKNSLLDPNWQPVSGTITHIGVKGFIQDVSAPGTQRFYRVRSF